MLKCHLLANFLFELVLLLRKVYVENFRFVKTEKSGFDCGIALRDRGRSLHALEILVN